jgi:MFS family permease
MTRSRWTHNQHDAALFLLYSAVFHIGFMGVVDVVLNFYFVSLGQDAETIGLLQSLPRLAGFVTSIPVSLCANRFGAYRVMLVSTIGCALAMGLLVVSPALPLLAASRFLMGFTYGAQQIAIAPLMVTLVERASRTQFFALHNVVSMAAAALGNFVGGRLPALIVGAEASSASAQTPFAYGAALAIAALITLGSVIPFLLLRHRQAVAVKPALALGGTPARTPWRHLVFIALPMLVFGFTGGLTFPFYNLFFRQQFALPDDAVGTILSIGWLGMAFIPLLNPWWERRFGRVAALAITMTIAAAGFFVLSIAPTLALSVAAFAVGISFRNTMQPLYQPLVLDSLPPDAHNNASGMSMVLWNIGWFGATAASGFLQAAYGFGLIMLLVAVGVLVTGAMILLIFRKSRASEPGVMASTLKEA